jgi:LysR family hydrogen peroxide-inducible transcriptional activator
MNNLTLKQMRYFEALARHRHFGRAADVCAISQPALSMQIKDLEETLGAALFERQARQLGLTGLGEDFLIRVQGILQAVDELSDLARASTDLMAGRLRFGVIPTIAPYMLPSVVRRLSDRHPELDIHVRETLTPTLLSELSEGRLDAALVALPVSEPSLTEVALFSEDFVLVRPAEDADMPVPDGDTLREMRLLLLEEGHCFRDQALAFCNQRQTRPRELLDGSSLTTLVQMVGAGLGVTLIPAMAVDIEARATGVAIAQFASPAPARTIGMIWRRTSPLARQFTQIAQIVRQTAQSLNCRLHDI